MRILFVTPRYFPLMGGVESHVYEVARRMADRAQVTVLTTDPRGELEPRENIEGVEVVRVRAMPAERDYYFAPGLVPVIAGGGWDVVHVQSYHTLVAPLAMLSALRARLPYLVTFHGGGHSSQLRNAARTAQQQLLRPLLARAARLVAIANFERDLYQQRLHLPRDKFVIIPNGADLPKPTDTPSPSTDELWIASVGRLERYKGHQHVIAALPYVLAQKPQARLWIAGTGPYEGALRQQAEELGVAERVRIEAVPPQERTRMARELERMSLVVLLSEYETHPIAILEALSLGRPVLVTQTSGLGELVERGMAPGIPVGSSPQVVAQAMLAQLDHPLVPKPVALPTWDECTNRLLGLYHSVVGGTQCAF